MRRWAAVLLAGTAIGGLAGCRGGLPLVGGGEEGLPEALQLASFFGPHAVLQRNAPLRIWGWDRPGQTVAVSFAGETLTTKADKAGRWSVLFPAMEAGGPYELHAAGSTTSSAPGILLGDVWVCSGQSNMEWTLAAADQEEGDLLRDGAPLQGVRLFKVPRRAEATPSPTVEATWTLAEGDALNNFSAVALHFGHKVHQKTGVPIGLMQSAWGGTRIEAWSSAEVLAAQGATEELQRLEEARAKASLSPKKKARLAAEFEKEFEDWYEKTYPPDLGNEGVGNGWVEPEFDDSQWAWMELPQPWEVAGLPIDGAIWFRRRVELPAGFSTEGLELHLGAIDDMDVTYVNGSEVGSIGLETQGFWTEPRVYPVAQDVAESQGRELHLAVRVYDHYAGGGIMGPEMKLRNARGQELDLAGPWRFAIERVIIPYQAPRPINPGEVQANDPGALYHGMLAPLLEFPIAGFLWYQGESNTGQPELYEERLRAFVKGLRAGWQQPRLPFYLVQLAPYANQGAPGNNYARLRESQRAVADSMDHAAMAVITDAGDCVDIHPRRKKPVGERLALLALDDYYEKDVVAQSPAPVSVEREGTRILVGFAVDEDAIGLSTPAGESLRGFTWVDGDGIIRSANASIVAPDAVALEIGATAAPREVRYGFADCPKELNLQDSSGLPATPFRWILEQ